MIKIEKLTKKYHGEYVLKNVGFEVNKNETLAIVGPSGSGKTTLLRCINHLEEATSGNVYLEGLKITKKDAKHLCLRIGMVFQHCNLFPHMTIMENLIYAPCKVLEQKPAQLRERARGLLDHFGMASKADSMPSALSGGQKQRVAIMRALMMDPEVMLFDEPTSALDPEVIKDLVSFIERLKLEDIVRYSRDGVKSKSKMTIIVVTHHLKFARAIADRIVFMDQGQVLCDQKTDEFFNAPASHRARLFLENVGDFL